MSRSDERGGVVVLTVLLISGLVMALATGLASRVRLDTRVQNAHADLVRSFALAESGLNRGMAEFRNIFLSFNVPVGDDFDARTFALSGQRVDYQMTDVAGNPRNVTLPAGDVFAGLNSQQYRYTVESDAVDGAGVSQAELGAEFDVNNVPLFQFIAFYNQDLEILPGQNMSLVGRVHTNGNLYLNTESGRTFTIADAPPDQLTVQVSTARDLFRGRLNDGACNGTVQIDILRDGPDAGTDLDPRTLACSGGTRLVPSAEIASWLGSIVTGVQNINTPQPDIVRRGSGVYWERAELRIVLDLTTTMQLGDGPAGLATIEVQTAAGLRDVARTASLHAFMTANPGKIFYNAIPTPGAVSPTACNVACAGTATNYAPAFRSNAVVYRRADDGNMDAGWTIATAPPNARNDYRRGGYFNNREGKWIAMLNVDVQALLAWNALQLPAARLFDPADNTDGGVVLFLSVIGPLSGTHTINPYGVRVFDSASLPFAALPDPTGLTVVSDQAVYLQGNFNLNPNWVPAAVMGDSINILSQAWETPQNGRPNDQKSRDTLASNTRDITAGVDTTVNAAFLGGVDATAGTNYNGGLENYPRFHEDWGGRTLFYRGSFVSLGRPEHVNGAWCGTGDVCNRYNPPTRNWNYDTRFNDARNLPPLTPRFVFVQQILFSQEFR